MDSGATQCYAMLTEQPFFIFVKAFRAIYGVFFMRDLLKEVSAHFIIFKVEKLKD